MFTEAQFIKAQSWKQPKYPSTGEWAKKTWTFYTMEYYSAIKNKLETFLGKWMQLETILSCEINQTHMCKYHICFYGVTNLKCKEGPKCIIGTIK